MEPGAGRQPDRYVDQKDGALTQTEQVELDWDTADQLAARSRPTDHRRLLADDPPEREALRHYHEIGLLQPAGVDRKSGYRQYEAEQVPVAQVIRRFRDLGMALDDVKRCRSLMSFHGTARSSSTWNAWSAIRSRRRLRWLRSGCCSRDRVRRRAQSTAEKA